MATVKSPKIFDPYLGEMYGNILDKYDNPAYNLRLYLKPTKSTPAATEPESEEDSGAEPAETGDQARDEIPTVTITAKRSKKEVTLAQTGVTATQIDDVEIQVKQDQKSETTTVNFRIIQPGAANFLDQVQYARKYLGDDDTALAAGSFNVYLDIKFLGYDHDPENNEEGGEPTQIGETITYKLTVTAIRIRVSNTGSEYMFETKHADTIGYNDTIFKFPKNFSIVATTITEAFQELEKQYNEYLEENDTVNDIADKVVFNLSSLIGGTGSADPVQSSTKKSITDETLPTPQNNTDVPTRAGPAYEKLDDVVAPDATGEVAGKSEEVQDGVKIDFLEGETIYKAVGKILSQNTEFQNLTTRQKDLNDPGNSEVDAEKTFIYWYAIHSQVENLEWDKARNAYSKRYTYTPYLTADARSDIALTTTEYDFLKETEEGQAGPTVSAIATKRLQDLYNANCLHKSYFYIFTGLNDQILNLDIDFDAGITLLMPPKGGMIGDFTLTQGPTLSNQEPTDKDLTLGDKLEAAKKEKNKDSLIDLFKKIKGLASSISDLATGLGKTVEEINAAVNDVSGKSAQTLANSIAGSELDSLLKKSGISEDTDPSDVPGALTEVTQQTDGNYAPEVSGYLYASAFVQPDKSISAEELESAGLTKMTTAVASLGYPVPDSRPVKSPLSGMTVNGPAGMLMGYAYRAREKTTFLLNVNLTLRGDPYWLTSMNQDVFETGAKEAADDADQTKKPSDKSYYFLLTIGQPSRFDFIVDDEDANSGYWTSGTSTGMLSGLYLPTTWVNSFSGGIFTTKIQEAKKEMSVPLQWIRPVAPGEEPVNWDDLGVNDNSIRSYIDDINKATDTGNDQIENEYEVGSAGGTVNTAAAPKPGDTVPELDRARLAGQGIEIGKGPDGTVTQGEIEALGQFTTVPRPTGNKREDALILYEWAENNGLYIDENQILAQEYERAFTDVHSGAGHAESRAFDINIDSRGGVIEANQPFIGYRFDKAAQALKAAGWTVVWRDGGTHQNHIHVEAPRSGG